MRIGLSVGIGTGGLFALWLATRRQRSAEQTLALQREVSQTTVNDSTERRITEQYNKAIEQLGHEKAAVRLGAIYSLERIAQEHVGHRQTVIDVFCSYLRLPYEPPADRKRWSKSSAGLSPEAAEALAELEVRYTIQGMFWEHLGDPEKRKVGEKHWPDLVLNLSRATLVDPVLRFLAVRGLWCEQLVVHGTADFRGLRVTHIASFAKARFHDRAVFADGIFSESVALIDCTFEAGADLSGAAFLGLVTLIGCHFWGEVDLGGHSSRGFAAHNCQFDHGLVLRSGKCTLVMISDSDLQGTFVTDDLEVSAGLLAGCSFRTQPDRHPKILLVDDLRDSDSYWRGVAAHFGIELDGTMMST